MLVGASGNADTKGAAFVYEKDAGGSWAAATALEAEGNIAGDAFGASVLMHGSVALVAAPRAGEGAGLVYAFEHDAQDSFTLSSRLRGSDSEEGDMFGSSLLMAGEMMAIGAPLRNGGRGAVYVFYRDDAGIWRQSAKIEVDGLPERSAFGSALHADDASLYVGAPGVDQRTGVVFQFAFDDAVQVWREAGRLTAFESDRFVQFGAALAMDGEDLWVGAPVAANGTGRIYRYVRGAIGWLGVATLVPESAGERASFGSAVAIKDKVAVIGAPGDDNGEGAAYVFQREDEGWRQRARLINEARGFDAITGAEVQCEDGTAGAWACDQVDLAAFLPLGDMGGVRGTRANDLWGWTDPESGREYALVGRSDGTAFVDVTDPYNPAFVGDLPMTEGSRANVWRDIKVYRNHAYIVADGAGMHGVQVFDLSQLRSVDSVPANFSETVLYDEIYSAHNIVINEETGFAFVVGASGGGETCGGGLHMIDIRKPASPAFAGCFADPTTGRRKTGYSHDAQCVIYLGPDPEHRGKEICIGSNETAMSISDVTDKDNPVSLSAAVYPNAAYTHQGWLTEDHRYFYMNDEGDEPRGLVAGTRTLVWDLADLDDPVLVKEYIAETTTTDHNLYVRGNIMYQSNYGSGLRILDITDPEDPVEVGYFDTAPHDAGGGSWSNYPYFKSGIIVVTSTGEGLFVLRQRPVDT